MALAMNQVSAVLDPNNRLRKADGRKSAHRGRSARASMSPDLSRLLKTYRQQLVAQGLPAQEIRKRIHLRAKSWLTQSMDWRDNPAVKTSAMRPGEYRNTLHLERQQFSQKGMGDFLPFNPSGPEPKDGGQGTWLSPSQVPAWDRESDKQLINSPESFGGMGAYLPIRRHEPEPRDGGQGTWLSPNQVPAWDRESAQQLINSPESFGQLAGGVSLGQPVPLEDMIKGEYASHVKLQNQQFSLNGMGQPVSPQAMIKGEYQSRIKTRGQKFSMHGMGAGYEANRDVPVSALRAGEFQRRLHLQNQNFGAYEANRDVNPASLRPGEYGPLRTQGQQFGGMGASYSSEVLRAAQGGYEANRDVPISALRAGEFQRRLKLQNQHFGGMGARYEAGRDVPTSAFRPGEFGPLRTGGQQFGGLGQAVSPESMLPGEYQSHVRTQNQQFELGSYESNRDVPISALSKGEYQRRLRLQNQHFGGMGATMSPQAAAQIQFLQAQAQALASGYQRPNTARGGSHQGGARMYVDPSKQVATSFIEREITLPEICDPKSGTCIRYAHPDPKVLGTSYVEGQTSLPAFYQHPSLGPWGVDPAQAYQYWAGQQAAMQALPYSSPMAIFGSPGLTATSPGELPPSAVARTATFDPYTAAFPTAGTAIERF